MGEPEAVLEALVSKLGELKDLGNVSNHVRSNIAKLNDERRIVLSQIETAFKDYDALKQLKLESSERELLLALEAIIRREKRYIRFLYHLLQKFADDIHTIHKNLFFFPPNHPLEEGSNIRYMKSGAREYYESYLNRLFKTLADILNMDWARLNKESNFVAKWLKGTGFLSFIRKKSVFNNFKRELTSLYAIYSEYMENTNAKLQELQDIQENLHRYKSQMIEHLQEVIAGSKNESSTRASSFSSFEEETDSFTNNVASVASPIQIGLSFGRRSHGGLKPVFAGFGGGRSGGGGASRGF